MGSTGLSRVLLLASLASVAASCSVVFGDFHVGTSTSTGSGGSGGSGGAGGGSDGCMNAPDCPKPSSSCLAAACVMNVCSTVNVNEGLTVPDAEQIPHDCQTLLCDGKGSTTSKIDDGDLPDDGEICTVDTCVAGVITHMPAAMNLDCAAQGPAPKKVCADPAGPNAGKCVECNTGAQCASAVCQGNACVPGSCNDATKNGTETDVDCGGGTCGDCANNKKCVTADDCISGNCLGTNCQPCFNDSYCSPAQHCKAGVCTPDQPTGASCTQGSQCQSNFCADGFCCDAACSGSCIACNLPGKQGLCSVVPAGQQDMNGMPPCSSNGDFCDGAGLCVQGPGSPCATNAECASGFCTDGVCCNNACGGTCQSCAVPSSPGSCSFVPVNGQDPNGAVVCSGNLACNGVGSCLKKNGVNCASSAECISGNCQFGNCQ